MTDDAGSPVVPAATDEPALAVIRDWIESMGYDDMGIEPASLVAALEANGYVLVPRKELDELLDASLHVGRYLEDTGGPYRGWLAAARAAVVEAVGPTP